jgi:hypothetical protein
MSRLDRTQAVRSVILISTLATAVACGDSSGAGGTGGTGTVTNGSTASVTSTNTTVAQSTTAAPASGQTSASSGPLTCDMPYSNVPEGECSLLAQNCGAGKTCVVNLDAQAMTATTVCTTTNGFKPRGAACGTNSECQAGLICIDKCTPICCPSNDEPCEGGECNINVTFNNSTFTAMVCAYNDACQLFTEMACPMGEVCHPADGLASCSTPSPNPVEEGEVCEFLNDCGDMQACIGQGAEYRCRYACMMGSMAAPGLGGCPAMQTCQPVDFGLPDIGACSPA